MTKSPFLSSFVLFFPPSHVRNTSLPSLVCSPCIHSTLFMQNAFYSADVLVHDSPRLHSVLAHTHTHKKTHSLKCTCVCVCVSLTLTHPMTLFLYLCQLNAHFRAAFCQDMKGVCECFQAEITASTQLHAKAV